MYANTKNRIAKGIFIHFYIVIKKCIFIPDCVSYNLDNSWKLVDCMTEKSHYLFRRQLIITGIIVNLY